MLYIVSRDGDTLVCRVGSEADGRDLMAILRRVTDGSVAMLRLADADGARLTAWVFDGKWYKIY